MLCSTYCWSYNAVLQFTSTLSQSTWIKNSPGFRPVLPDYLSQIGVPFHIEERDTYSIVKRLIPKDRPPVPSDPDSVVASTIASLRNWARPRSHWITITMTLLKPYS